MKISKNPNTNWENNNIQFPRLIAEMEIAGLFRHRNVCIVAESMDLDCEEIYEIIERAQKEWDKIKSKTLKSK